MSFNLQDKNPLRKKFFGLISCGDAKREYACAARSIYTSPILKIGTKWMEENCSPWYILSAKYGLLHPDKVISPYNTYLPDMDEDDRLEWAEMVRQQLRKANPNGRPIVYIGGVFYLDTVAEGVSKKKAPEITGIFQKEFLDIGNRGKRAQWMKQHPFLTKKLAKELNLL